MSITLQEIKRCISKGNTIPVHRIYELVGSYLNDTIPWTLLDKKYRQGFIRDLGIDAFNPQTKKALQVKHYTVGKVYHKNLGTFYAFSKRIRAKKLVLVALSKKCLSREVNDIYFHESGPLMKYKQLSHKKYTDFIENLEYMDSEPFNSNYYFSEEIQEFIIYKNLVMRQYQEDAVNSFLKSEKDTFRIRMATGLGKSLIIKKIAEHFNKVCIIVPYLSILVGLSGYFDPEDIQLVGTDFNHNLDLNKRFIIAVENSVSYLQDIDFDLIIYDEAHHTYKYSRELFFSKRTLELSATLKGEVDIDFNLVWGIENGWLTDYNLELVLYKGDKQRALVSLINQRVEFNRILGFCNSLESLYYVESLLKEENISYGVIIADTSMEKRDKIINKFKDFKIRVLLSVGCIGEGIDIPESSTCIFFDGITDSDRSLQRMGRVLRKDPRKEKAFVVAPVNVESEDNELALCNFIKMLGKCEENINDFLRSGRVIMTNTIHEESEVERDKYFEIIETKIFENIRDGWRIVYDMLLDYVNKKGKNPSENDENKVNCYMAKWIFTQRQKNKEGKLSEERKNLLELIPGWIWELDLDLIWLRRYKDLKEFIDESGKMPVSTSEDPDERSLRSWIHRQIKLENSGKLPQDRLMKMNEIENWNMTIERRWIRNKNLYVKFKNDNKGKKPKETCNNRKSEEQKLCKWMQHNIERYKLNKLSANRLKILDEEIPDWKGGRDEEWMKNRQDVIDFLKTSKTFSPREDSSEEEIKLYRWFHKHTMYKKNGIMPKFRFEFFDSLSEIVKLWKLNKK